MMINFNKKDDSSETSKLPFSKGTYPLTPKEIMRK